MLHKINARNELLISLQDLDGNNMLHLVGLLTKKSIDVHNKDNIVHEPVLEMQEEKCWFQILEETLHLPLGDEKSSDGLIPNQLFNENHRELTTDGVEWSKKTCSDWVVVAVLLASLSLGYDQSKSMSSGYVLINGFIISKSMSFMMACLSIGLASYLSSSNHCTNFSSLPYKLVLAKVSVCASVMCVILALIFNPFIVYEDTSSKIPYIMMASSIVDIMIFIYWVSEYQCSVSTSTIKSRLRGI